MLRVAALEEPDVQRQSRRLREFVEEAKASGLVHRAIDRAGLGQFRVATSARTN